MALSKRWENSKIRFFSRLLPNISEASAETIEILTDVEQVTDLLCSLDEARKGHVVSFMQAFGDL